MKKRRAEDSNIDQEENSKTETMEDSNISSSSYIHRFISLEEGWDDTIKPKVSVCDRGRLVLIVVPA
jgi:hypothetical protein